MVMDLACEEIGGGEPVLVLHGLLGSSRNWRNTARALSRDYRVLCVDLRNHGRSPASATMSYVEMVDDVLRLIKSMSLHRPAIVGHSMGGKVAMALALLHPDAIGTPIVIDVAPISYPDRLLHEALRAVDVVGASIRGDIDRCMSLALLNPVKAGLMLQDASSSAAHFDWRSNLANIGLAAHELYSFPESLRSRRYARPLHVVAGSRSDFVERRGPSGFAPMFPFVEMEVVDGAGHWIHADKPTELVDVLCRRLSRARQGAPAELHSRYAGTPSRRRQ